MRPSRPRQYDLIKTTLAELKEHEWHLVLSTARWSSYTNTTPLAWQVVKFESGNKTTVPDGTKGVYTFLVKPDIAAHPDCSHLLYVGKTVKQNFRKRFSQYFDEARDPKGRPLIQRMMALYPNHLWFCYAPISDASTITAVEEALINAYLPPCNTEDFEAVIRKAIKAW